MKYVAMAWRTLWAPLAAGTWLLACLFGYIGAGRRGLKIVAGTDKFF